MSLIDRKNLAKRDSIVLECGRPISGTDVQKGDHITHTVKILGHPRKLPLLENQMVKYGGKLMGKSGRSLRDMICSSDKLEGMSEIEKTCLFM